MKNASSFRVFLCQLSVGVSFGYGAHVSAADWSVTDLGTLPKASVSGADGISVNGRIVGHAYGDSGINRAFLYDGGTMLDIGTLYGWPSSIPYGINASGQVIGNSSDGISSSRAFLYN